MEVLWNAICLDLIDLTMFSMLLWLLKSGNTMSLHQTKSFRLALLVSSAVLITDILTILFEHSSSSYRIASMIVNALGFSLCAFIPLVLSSVLRENISRHKIIFLPAIVNLIFSLASPWTGWIFVISEDNHYSRGPLYHVFIIAYIAAMLILFYSWQLEMRQYVRQKQTFLIVLLLQFLVWSTIQVLIPSIHCNWHSVTLLLMLYYVFVREQQYKYDAVTNMLNRQAFDRELDRLEKCGHAGVILFDVDNFKKINDTYGHLQGVRCLEKIAGIICESFCELGGCFRIGGDEFCVLTEVQGVDDIHQALGLMLSRIEEARKADPTIPMVSYGFSPYSADEHRSIRAAMEEADKNMYRYKSQRH